jgi:hypothetical protein
LLKPGSKQRVRSKRGNQKPLAKASPARTNSRIASAARSLQAEGRRSTAASLLRSAPGWCGEDLDEIVRIVAESRSKRSVGASYADDADENASPSASSAYDYPGHAIGLANPGNAADSSSMCALAIPSNSCAQTADHLLLLAGLRHASRRGRAL